MDLSAYREVFLILFIVLVLATNVWLFTSFKKNKSESTFHILKKSGETLRDPFKKEKKDLEELSLLVKNIKNQNEENL
jgi:hypothetical protein